MDSATEYEKNAHKYLRVRDESLVGYKVVRQWANKLPVGTEVIEIACGGGYPVTRELAESGLNIYAIDSSKTLLTEFQKRFPNFFNRKFDAAIAIGLIFLLPEIEQIELINRVSKILNHGGRFYSRHKSKVESGLI